MRILLVLHPAGNFSIPGSMTWHRNLYSTLVDMGHDVFLVRLDRLASEWNVPFRSDRFRERLDAFLPGEFYREHDRKKFDFILTYLTHLDISVGSLARIKEAGVMMANFSCNNTQQFHLVRGISAAFDYNLHAEKNAGEKFMAAGTRPYWFQMAANPVFYHPVKTERKYDFSFAGMNYALRLDYINHLILNGQEVHCFGPNWIITGNKAFRKEIKRMFLLFRGIFTMSPEKRYEYSSWINYYDKQKFFAGSAAKYLHHAPGDEELVRIISQTGINLGFLEVNLDDNRPGSPAGLHLHLREFEVPMCRGLLMTNFSEELAEHYEPEKEVITFRNKHELLDKARYYLEHPSAADKIREAGYRRALGCHTWQHRFDSFFKEAGLKGSSHA